MKIDSVLDRFIIIVCQVEINYSNAVILDIFSPHKVDLSRDRTNTEEFAI